MNVIRRYVADYRQGLRRPIAALPWIGYFGVMIACVAVIEWGPPITAWEATAAKVIAVGASTALFTRFLGGMGMFRDAIADVLGDDKWLDRRNDLEDLWRRISRRVFMPGFSESDDDAHRFLAELNKTMSRVIHHPTNRSRGYYSKQANRRIDIKWLDRARHLVTVTDELRCDVVVFGNARKETYDVVFTPTATDNIDESAIELGPVEIDGNPVDVEPMVINARNAILPIPLTGGKVLPLLRTVIYRLNLRDDPFYYIAAGHVVWGMNIIIKNHASDLKVNFDEVGIQGVFKCVKDEPGFIELDTKAVLLPEQGIATILALDIRPVS